MARGTALSDLLEMLKAELDADMDSDVSPGGDDVLMVQLSNQQKWLANRYRFSDLTIRRDMNVVAGTRYYDFPNTAGVQDFNQSSVIVFECYWSNLWYSVEPGIKLVNYNTINPELNQRLDPVIRWQKYRKDATTWQFEVWPLPASATRLRLTGQMELTPLVAPTDLAQLDDLLIVQFTAAKALARMKSGNADAMLAEAKETLNKIIGGDNGPSEVFSLGGRMATQRRHRSMDTPTVATNFTP